MRYILHYTGPGDIVFDGFCGTAQARPAWRRNCAAHESGAWLAVSLEI